MHNNKLFWGVLICSFLMIGTRAVSANGGECRPRNEDCNGASTILCEAWKDGGWEGVGTFTCNQDNCGDCYRCALNTWYCHSDGKWWGMLHGNNIDCGTFPCENNCLDTHTQRAASGEFHIMCWCTAGECSVSGCSEPVTTCTEDKSGCSYTQQYCGTTSCPDDYCGENTPFNYENSCENTCSGGDCHECSCSATSGVDCTEENFCGVESGFASCSDCGENMQNCNLDSTDECESDIRTDHENCGVCGNACDEYKTCCEKYCVNTQLDEYNCGVCGNLCGADQSCEDSNCCNNDKSSCTSGSECCSGLCDLTDSVCIAACSSGISGHQIEFEGQTQYCCYQTQKSVKWECGYDPNDPVENCVDGNVCENNCELKTDNNYYCALCQEDSGYDNYCTSYCDTVGCNIGGYYFCEANNKDYEKYCDECNHCGDGIVDCGEECEDSTAGCQALGSVCYDSLGENHTRYTFELLGCKECSCLFGTSKETDYCNCGNVHNDGEQNCGEIGIDCGWDPEHKCTSTEGEICDQFHECASGLECVEGHCCPTGECWVGTECGEGGDGRRLCSNGIWYDCNNCGTVDSWVCLGSGDWLLGKQEMGETCCGDEVCVDGSVCCNYICKKLDGESCLSPEDCCSENCDQAHCCPVDHAWCSTGCVYLSFLGDDCVCENQCAQGTCAGGVCVTSDECSGAGECASGLECALNRDEEYSYCCSLQSCYEDGCVSSGGMSSDNMEYCKGVVWVEFCNGLLAGQGPYVGNCSSLCEADVDCDLKPVGWNSDNYACNSECEKVTQKVNLTVELWQCLDLENCFALESDTLDEGMMLLVDYMVDMPNLDDANISISLNGQEIKQDYVIGGYHVVEDLTLGTYAILVEASNPDFVDEVFEQEIKVVGDVKGGGLKLVLSPEYKSVVVGDTATFNLEFNNTSDQSFDLGLSANLDANVDGEVTVNAQENMVVPVLVTPTQTGDYLLNVTITSNNGQSSVSLGADIHVVEEDFYSVDLIPVIEDDEVKLIIINDGTLDDTYNIDIHGVTQQISLAAGATYTLGLGGFSEPFSVCVESEDVRKCTDVGPVYLEVYFESGIQAYLGQESSLEYSISTGQGEVQVESDSTWFSEFTCEPPCEGHLKFTPDAVGEFDILFTIEFDGVPDFVSSTIIVGVPESEVDVTELMNSANDVGERLDSLESLGIYVPEARKIVDEVKSSAPETVTELADLKGRLNQALRYIKYAAETTIPEMVEEMSILHLIVGGVALLGGICGLIMVFTHHEHPHFKQAPTQRRFGYKPGGRPIHSKPVGKGQLSKKPTQSPAKMFKDQDIPKIPG